MKYTIRKIANNYLLLSGIIVHFLVVGLFIFQPFLIDKLISKVTNQYYSWQKTIALNTLTQGQGNTLKEEISSTFYQWEPQKEVDIISSAYEVNGLGFNTLDNALSVLKDGDQLLISKGVYTNPIVIKKNDITIKGVGHVVFQKGTAEGKGFILSKGNNLTIINIECRNIANSDGNGACIRQEGINLTLHHVFFHSSQEGILETASHTGFIKVYNSRFERLGFDGQAHGIYTNKAELYIENSLFIATKNEGNAIKVRGKKLFVKASILVSLSAGDSRLIDMSNGGQLMVVDSILGQGPNSVNSQVIGYGLEKMSHQLNDINLTGNLVYLDRLGENYLLALPKNNKKNKLVQNNNMIIGKDSSGYQSEHNMYFINRKELGLPAYPNLPKDFCSKWGQCPVK